MKLTKTKLNKMILEACVKVCYSDAAGLKPVEVKAAAQRAIVLMIHQRKLRRSSESYWGAPDADMSHIQWGGGIGPEWKTQRKARMAAKKKAAAAGNLKICAEMGIPKEHCSPEVILACKHGGDLCKEIKAKIKENLNRNIDISKTTYNTKEFTTMKLTKSKLKQIIQEELKAVLNESLQPRKTSVLKCVSSAPECVATVTAKILASGGKWEWDKIKKIPCVKKAMKCIDAEVKKPEY